jgi:hypothetical protein
LLFSSRVFTGDVRDSGRLVFISVDIRDSFLLAGSVPSGKW